jgi:hypothetical protein
MDLIEEIPVLVDSLFFLIWLFFTFEKNFR